MAGLKQLESYRDNFRQLMMPIGYSLHIEETISYAKEKCNGAVNKQV
jgi:hypothetical protein